MVRHRGIVLAAAVLLLGIAGCASSAHQPGGSTAATATAPQSAFPTQSPFPTRSRYPCGAKREAALTTFNRDGSVRWNVTLPAGDGSNVAPLADHDVLFSGSAGSVSALRTADGAKRWDVHLGSAVYNLWLVDGVLVVNVDQVSNRAKIVGLDPASGATRWTYPVPDGGFLGDAVLSGDGGLAFRVADGMLTMIDVSDGHVRWSRHVGAARSPDGLPSSASGLVVYTDAEGQMYALDSRTGALKWQVPAGLAPEAGETGRVVVSAAVGVVVPDVISGPSITVVAHALADGHEVWRRRLADISAVYPDAAGFVLADYRADTVTLVRPTSGKQVWQAGLHKIDNLEQAPIAMGAGRTIAVLERSAVAFIDHDSGSVRQVPLRMGIGRAAGPDDDLMVSNGQQVALLTPAGTSWTAALPHFGQTDPAALDDGGTAVESEDPECASF